MQNHHGGMTLLDGSLYGANGGNSGGLPMLLIDPNPKAYLERGRFEQPGRGGKPAWVHPVIANGRLYLRDQDLLLAYDIRAR